VELSKRNGSADCCFKKPAAETAKRAMNQEIPACDKIWKYQTASVKKPS
jgi:hypothetical protein